MARLREKYGTEKSALSGGWLVAAIVMVMTLVGAPAMPAGAADNPLSEADQQCLGCHGAAKFEKKLKNGDTLSLHVPGPAFAASVHNVIGCASCHADMTLTNHPPTKKKITSSREYSVAAVAVCRQCHDDKFKLYEGSIHAALLKDGNPIAPVCTDCHNPHAVRPQAARSSLSEIPCQKCHGSIYEAYAASVHGTARAKSNKSAAPICSDCHHAHDIDAASTGAQPKNACYGCHQNVLSLHQEWLPNAETHLQVISCPACHAPNAKRRVDLRLYNSASQQNVTEKEGVPQFETRARAADEKGRGLDALALQSLISKFNADGAGGKTMLRGRLEVSDGAEKHMLAGKDKAISDCAICHRAGGMAFESVIVSIIGPDGRPVRYDAQKDVLNSAVSIDSVRGFYAIGSTRIKLLDWLLVLALLSGIAVPVCHQTVRWLLRRRAAKIRAEGPAHGPDAAQKSDRDPKA